jgi:predicted ATP-grasp superfamily ATP-dependent carboligase
MHKNNHDTKVLVTDAGRGCSIATIRSLGRAGYKVIAADANPRSIGFQSRFVYDKVVYPPPASAPQEFIEFLSKTAVLKELDLIIPITEFEIEPLIGARESIERVTRIALSDNESLAFVTDKSKTLQLAKKLGIPIPETRIVNNATEALKCTDQLTWPIVLKPQSSKKLCTENKIESFAVTYAGSPDELRKAMQQFEGKCAILLQSYHKGVGYGIELLMHMGEPIAAFAHKRLREFPITGGPSSYRESVELDSELYAYSLSLLKELKWTGLAMVEFKVNGSDAVLIEINGRVWGSLPLAVVSGVNFPLLLTKLFLDGPDSLRPQLDGNYKVGLRCRDLQRDLMWIGCVLSQKQRYPFFKMPSRMQALQAMLGMFNPMRKFDLFCLDDPKPGMAEIPRIVKKFREKMSAQHEK